MYVQVQLTDFENAAYMVFMVLLTRVILTFHLNFIIPISKVPFLYNLQWCLWQAVKRSVYNVLLLCLC